MPKGHLADAQIGQVAEGAGGDMNRALNYLQMFRLFGESARGFFYEESNETLSVEHFLGKIFYNKRKLKRNCPGYVLA